MAFNPYGGFYPSYQMNMQPASAPAYSMNQYQQPQQATQDERIWVQNATAAEAYLVAPNSFVRLWDSSRPVFYEKRADATGRPLPIEVYEYTKRSGMQTQAQDISHIDYGKEIESLKARLTALESMKEGKANDKSKSDADVTSV